MKQAQAKTSSSICQYIIAIAPFHFGRHTHSIVQSLFDLLVIVRLVSTHFHHLHRIQIETKRERLPCSIVQYTLIENGVNWMRVEIIVMEKSNRYWRNIQGEEGKIEREKERDTQTEDSNSFTKC